jgi:hypothetical protein
MSEAADDPESLIVLCDENVLYSIVLTDLILSLVLTIVGQVLTAGAAVISALVALAALKT